ncbi:MAG: ABC transporter ATP-binding protein [Flavobacteriales bacterium]|jgi:lipopolysaccharide transport system ATP-binding protein|nr:ABC transporter ATP-binding protein [Flavobacteriales bacterium]
MSREELIRVEGVSKKYCTDLRRSLRYGMEDLIGEVRGKPRGSELREKEFWAVRNVDLVVRRGECLGLIGHNGAGKTTLLRMLNGLVKPDTGRIEIRGRVGALIALGAGFNPILTGRENIYVNASVLGMRRADVEARIEEVIEFSEIRAFIDTPVRNYSSGMTVRLGFSVAALMLEPDILFLDEVLAVGDMAFTLKCLNLMRSIMDRTACVFVSHNMPLVSSFCTHVHMMHRGQLVSQVGEPMEEVIARYVALAPALRTVFGEGAEVEARILSDAVRVDADGRVHVAQGTVLDLEVDLTVKEPVTLQFVLQTQGTIPLVHFAVEEAGEDRVFAAGTHRFVLPLGPADFNSGRYGLLATVRRKSDRTVIHRKEGLIELVVTSNKVSWAHIMKRVSIAENGVTHTPLP